MTLPAPSAVVFVADVPGMTRFYQSLADMRLLHEDAEHAVLEIAGFQLVVHRLRGAPRAREGQVLVRQDSYVKICLPVESLAAARARAAALGGLVKSAEHEFVARGFRACDGNDPEGNVMQVREDA
jgi:predicted enzyme related to lactoylglutathione lyase